MSKNLAEYEKGHPWRIATARRVRQARNAEREGVYQTARELDDYEDILAGLVHSSFLSHIKTFQSPTIVAIGEGKAIAVDQFRKTQEAKGIRVIPTGLIPYHNNQSYKNASVRLTPAETLRIPIKDAAVSAVLAVYSTTYCRIQKLTNIRIDQILTNGGIYKAVYPTSLSLIADQMHPTQQGMHAPDQTVKFFKSKGYDVATGLNPLNKEAPTVIIAIKPDPNRKLPSAKSILEEDMEALLLKRIEERGLGAFPGLTA